MSDPRRNAEGYLDVTAYLGASRELGFALGADKIIVSLEQLLTKEVTLS